MTSIHIPTAIATRFSTPVNVLFILLSRDMITPGYKVLSDLLVSDNYIENAVPLNEWELMYRRNAKWGDVYTPLIDEHIDVYKLFFHHDISEHACPITDQDLAYFIKNIRTTPYTRWCISICMTLWSLMMAPINCTAIQLICKNILSYMRNLIYQESKYHLDAYFNDTMHMSKFKTRISQKRRRLPGGHQ